MSSSNAAPDFSVTDSSATGIRPFAARHIGISETIDQHAMLKAIGYESMADLLGAAVPSAIRMVDSLDVPAARTEAEVAALLRALAAKNVVRTSMIGLGYYDTITPAVIRRNVLESPAWYTAYTPYQPEISQGRLEALLNFQTMVGDLTGLPTAGASLLDEGTAAAEAMALAHRTAPAAKKGASVFLIDADAFPQTIDVVRTRAEALGLSVLVADLEDGAPDAAVFGALLQYPGASGAVRDLGPLVAALHERGAVVAVAADLLALTMLTPPGEFGADIAVGTSQRFGVPMGFGGPHAGYLAIRAGLERQLPGRLVGVSVDAAGRPAFRLALQTREQHIRREKATSNICTAQVLLAVMASMYAVYHGPTGLRAIAATVHRKAAGLAQALADAGVDVLTKDFFDTVTVRVPGRAAQIVAEAERRGVNLLLVDEDRISLSCDEATGLSDLTEVLSAFGGSGTAPAAGSDHLPLALRRTSDFLTHPVFNTHHSETSMLRYLRSLSDKDYALDRGMIPLGSCTMKLNATTEMEPVTNPGFAQIHPFAPVGQFDGYAELVADLQKWLTGITGYDSVSLQPNAGAQGEFAGLLAIKNYHRSRGDDHRDVCLIPASAHGTNAASAVLAGMRVVVVATSGTEGEVDLADLTAKIAEHADRLAAIMVTYPSTHGVFEDHIGEVCELVHAAGGQVYVDGANLNAMVGLARPGQFGADVSHLNLHKTFCIPHGGGGPGVGPVAVRAHLAPFLPNHPMQPTAGPATGSGAIAAAPWGSASILPITWAYIRLMGPDGLVAATSAAILSANYIAARLSEHFPVLYTGARGLVAHECILDLRELTRRSGVTVDDVAKRLIDYGFHAPTMSFPVAGTLMVEPTESEDLVEIDRFIEAMIAIRGEIEDMIDGRWPADDNPLRNAPHTAQSLVEQWDHPYSRAEAVYPAGVDPSSKYWTPVRRIDGAYGDRNLMCSCPPVADYA
jgi:glycine dehydrogenase